MSPDCVTARLSAPQNTIGIPIPNGFASGSNGGFVLFCELVDNASFHKKKVLNRIADSYGCRIIWLPPYSPDKNPIEKVWANLKNWLRINAKNYTDIRDAISAYFQS